MTTGAPLDGKITMKEFVTKNLWLARERPWFWWVFFFLIVFRVLR